MLLPDDATTLLGGVLVATPVVRGAVRWSAPNCPGIPGVLIAPADRRRA